MAALVGGLLVITGCGGGAAQIVPTRQISQAGDSPEITRIVDLGDISIPDSGALPPGDSDGVFVVGELVLIQGSSFGRQPTIQIGSRPADAIARMGDGAIIARIPPGVPSGKVKVRVSHSAGASEKTIEVRRYGFVVQPKAPAVHVIRVLAGREAVRQASIGVANTVAGAMSPNGQTALFVVDDGGGKPWIAIVATSGSGGPKLVHHVKLSGMTSAQRIIAARTAPVAAVVGGRTITLLDLSNARNPAPYEPWTLPKDVEAPVAVAVQPGGKLMALLLPTHNALLPVDISDPAHPRALAPLALAVGQRVPVVRDLVFTPKGDEIWVLSGDTALSLIAGNHPTRLTAVSVDGSSLKVRRSVDIPAAGAVYGLAIAPRERIRGGTALRSLDRVAETIVVAVDRAVWNAARTKQPLKTLLAQSRDLGQLIRTDMEGGGSTLWHAEAVATDAALSHDALWTLAAVNKVVRKGGKATVVFGALVTPIGEGPAEFLKLGELSPGVDLLTPASVVLAP